MGLPEANPGVLDLDGMMVSWSTVNMLNEAISTDLHRGIVEAQCPTSKPDIEARVDLVPECLSGWGYEMWAVPDKVTLPQPSQAVAASGETACLGKRLSTQGMKPSSRFPSAAVLRVGRRARNVCIIGSEACMETLAIRGPGPIKGRSLGGLPRDDAAGVALTLPLCLFGPGLIPSTVS